MAGSARPQEQIEERAVARLRESHRPALPWLPM
jgi:hypothetical protein